MARGSTRGFGDPVVILLALGTASLTAGGILFTNPQDGAWWTSPVLWFVLAIVFFVVAVSVHVASRYIWPRFRGGEEESPLGEDKEINVTDSPGANIQASQFKELPDKINVERSPEATVNFDTTDDEEEETENDNSQETATE